MNADYVIISPVRNEARHLPGTIVSISAQTIRPAQWIVVDDGSTDASPAILDEAAERFPWITLVKRKDRGCRQPGTGVIEAFYEGFARLNVPWGFIVKLDGDVTFAPDYFERCLGKFAAEPRLGIGGGTVCNLVNGKNQPESAVDPAFHVRGATKIYRKECWAQIGELIRAPGWDTLDELKANMLGWSTRTFPDVVILHHKPAGSADGSWRNWVKNGLANYIVGYHPLFMLVKVLRRTLERPYGIGAAGLFAGYLKGYLWRVPQIPDRPLIDYLRSQQMRKLTFKKSLWQ